MLKLKLTLSALCAISLASAGAQDSPAAPLEEPAPIEPPIEEPLAQPIDTAPAVSGVPATATSLADPGTLPAGGTFNETTTTTTITSTTPARTINEFEGEEIGSVLRLLARQAKVNMVVSEKIVGTVTMRLENLSPLEAINVVVTSKALSMDEINGVLYVKTPEEKAAEPTASASYTFSYAKAETILPLLQAQLRSGAVPQFDARTNTVFYREFQSNMDNVGLFLATVDTPTQQVMIEARLIEVTANPRQGYGINWAGVVGSAVGAPQRLGLGGSTIESETTNEATTTGTTGGAIGANVDPPTTVSERVVSDSNAFDGTLNNFFRSGNVGSNFLGALSGQFAILSAPSLSLTLRLLNEDADAEFLANPRVVTANNQKATIEITRAQPVPTLNFNEQTAQTVFGGFEDKKFGNTLEVTPSINKDDFITLNVLPEISNKVGDATFTIGGGVVTSPIIDTRKLNANVLIKSGDTLAIGGLLQDETVKTRTKVPLLGDIPIIGYAFQEKTSNRVKRNLLVFVTPTIIKQGYGTGLEDQVTGIHHVGEEYADPNGWRNNARGAVRILPTSHRQNVTDYPKPGTPAAPRKVVNYKVSATAREK